MPLRERAPRGTEGEDATTTTTTTRTTTTMRPAMRQRDEDEGDRNSKRKVPKCQSGKAHHCPGHDSKTARPSPPPSYYSRHGAAAKTAKIALTSISSRSSSSRSVPVCLCVLLPSSRSRPLVSLVARSLGTHPHLPPLCLPPHLLPSSSCRHHVGSQVEALVAHVPRGGRAEEGRCAQG